MTTTSPHQGGSGEGISPREQLDLLVSRIADGEASEHDWKAFNTLAESQKDAWKQLAQAQRQHGELSLAVSLALHAADRSELPLRSQSGAGGFDGRDAHARDAFSPTARLRAWGGWAVAAAVALAWLGGNRLGVISPVGGPGPGNQQAGMVNAGWTSDDYANAYLDKGQKEGRVFGELASRPIEIRPAEKGGGYEVLYVRQILEQARVNDLVKFGVDEAGRPVPVKYNVPVKFTPPE
jgi:hypothetical protein